MKDNEDSSDDSKSPLALAIIARLKKKARPMDSADDQDQEPDGDEAPEGKVDDEAALSACEDIIGAIRDRDAQALKDALDSYCKARGY